MGPSQPVHGSFGRLLGVCALVASVALHGGAAAVALLVLPRVMSSAEVARRDEAPVVVDFDIAMPAEPDARLQSARLASAARRTVPSHRARAAAALPAVWPERLPQPATESAPVAAALDAPGRPAAAHFALSAGSIAGRSEVAGRGGPAPDGIFGTTARDAEDPVPEGAVDVPAKIDLAAPPIYPEAARRAEVELDLALELVVSPQGRVVRAQALAHPGYGLEEAALTAARTFVFHPAQRHGRAVFVRMKWTMQFRLR